MPPLVQAYCDDLVLIAHSLPQFLEYAAAIARYLTDMGMSLNVGKCAYANTARIQFDHGVPEPREHGGPMGMLTCQGHGTILGPAPRSQGDGDHEGETCTPV